MGNPKNHKLDLHKADSTNKQHSRAQIKLVQPEQKTRIETSGYEKLNPIKIVDT